MADQADDYLGRLEAALKAREAGSVREPQRAVEHGPPRTAAPAPPAEPSLVAEAFAALLALEEGEPGARPVRLVMGNADVQLTDSFINEVARRVAERLTGE